MRIRQPWVLLAFLLGMVTTSCNLFSPFDRPTNDEQNLSYARACFDQGDYDCARDHYAELSGTSYADIKISETAFTIFDEEGADIGAVVGGAAKGDYGKIFTAIANRMLETGDGATEARRIRIFNAFRTAKDIGNPQLQGLVRFMGAAALAAQLLGEDAVNFGQSAVTEALIADNPSSCSGNAEIVVCAPGNIATCLKTGTLLTVVAPVDLWATVPPVMTGAPTLDMVKDAMNQVNQGLVAIGVGGSLGTSMTAFGNALSAFSLAVEGADCFRYTMLAQKVGQE